MVAKNLSNKNNEEKIIMVTQRKRLFIRPLGAVLVWGVLLYLPSCTQAEFVLREDNTIQGPVKIYPDMSDHTLPAVQYHFYHINDVIACITRECDGKGNFEGTLPVGTYRVIATNINAGNVDFSEMGSHRSAKATLSELSSARAVGFSRAADFSRAAQTVLAQPGKVYSTIIEELSVTAYGDERHTPSPALLTRQVTLSFTLLDGLEEEVATISGTLNGVYPSVQLYSCQYSTESSVQSPTMAVQFQTTAEDNVHRARVSLFGLCNPSYGTVYSSVLQLQLDMNDGNTDTTNFDLTNSLSAIIEQNAGTIPIQLQLLIELRKTDVGIEVGVVEWVEGGEDEQDIYE